VIKRTLESGAVVPGGGAVESALSIYLENFATTLVSNSTFLFAKALKPAVGLARTACDSRVCQRASLNPQNACRQCSQGLDRTRSQAALIP
jgi:hypothetical protein